jgi:xylan 1,4-beta-xylosidase
MNAPLLKIAAAIVILGAAVAATTGDNPPAPTSAPAAAGTAAAATTNATAPATTAATDSAAAPVAAAFPVTITVDASKTIGSWKPIFRFFGADEPNYATMKDGKKLIGELGALRPDEVYFRTHNLLNTGDGTAAYKWGSTNAYTEDADGKPVYNWTILDQIFDTYRAAGIHPYVEIGFMPEALSTHPEPYQHHWKPGDPYSDIYTGWAYPPKDYDKWGELVYQWAKHCVDRYGMAEVEKWYWEVWNESNTQSRGVGYWSSTPQEYMKLYDYSAAAVRRAIPNARVGGADSAGDGGAWSRNFVEHCLTGTNYVTGKVGSPLDFFSFHAKGGTPGVVAGHVQMGIGNQLKTIDAGFAIAASHPETKPLPIVIGESDPDGCAACTSAALSAYRPNTVYASYTAACIAREFELADRRGVNIEGALSWAFEFENEPYFSGQRVLATEGLDLPILNLFRMYTHLDGQRIATTSTNAYTVDDIMRGGVRKTPDVSAISTLAPGKLCVLAWHYHDILVPGPDADVTLNLSGLPANIKVAKVTEYRIDDTHSNSFTAWQRMGSPAQPTPEQYAQLEKGGQLEQMTAPATADSTKSSATPEISPMLQPIVDGKISREITLPRQGVSLLVVEWDKTLEKTP